MQFTNGEITLIKSAALNRYLQLGFTEKDAEVLYGNFISNISNSKPKKAQSDEDKSLLSGLHDKIPSTFKDSRGDILGGTAGGVVFGGGVGGGVGALGGGLAGFLAPNNDAGFPERLARALRWMRKGMIGGAVGGAAGGGLASLFGPNIDAGGSLDLNRSDERKEERARVIRAQERARMNKHDSRVSENDRAIDELISQ